MDSLPSQRPSFNLPPEHEGLPPLPLDHEALTTPPENLMKPEVASQTPSQTVPVLPIDPAQIAQPISDMPMQVVTSDQVTTDTPTPHTDDRDLIPREWVIKVKSIVERTRTDPYEQSKEINKLKAQYIQQRYNMTIKASED